MTTENPAAKTDAIDDLDWDLDLDGEDWTPAEICSIENGPDCEACEG